MKSIQLFHFDFFPRSFFMSLPDFILYDERICDMTEDENISSFDESVHASIIILPMSGMYDPVPLLKELKRYNKPVFVVDARFNHNNKVKFTGLGADFYFHFPMTRESFAKYMRYYCVTVSRKLCDRILTYKDLSMDLNKRIVLRSGVRFDLRNKEFELLKYFMNNTGIILSKRRILEEVWDMNADINTTTVEAHICSLRNKIDNGFEEKRLHTVHCVGYKLE